MTKEKFKEDILHYAIAYVDYMHELNTSHRESLEGLDVQNNLIKSENEISNNIDKLFNKIDKGN
jgi:hypothetical protein